MTVLPLDYKLLSGNADTVGQALAVHLPPMWDTVGLAVVFVNGRDAEAGKVLEYGGKYAETVRELGEEFVKAVELCHRNPAVRDKTVSVHWRTHKYYPEYNDYYRKTLFVEWVDAQTAVS